MPRFLDANIFLRYLLNDDPVRSPACKSLFAAIEQATIEAWTSELVVSEVVFVLANPKTYNIPRPRIAATLLPLLLLPKLKLPNRRIYRRVFDLYTTLPISYVDCYNAALMEFKNQKD